MIVVAARAAKIGCPGEGGAVVVASQRRQLDEEVCRRSGLSADVGRIGRGVLAVVVCGAGSAGGAAGARGARRRRGRRRGGVDRFEGSGGRTGRGGRDGRRYVDDVELDVVAVAVASVAGVRPDERSVSSGADFRDHAVGYAPGELRVFVVIDPQRVVARAGRSVQTEPVSVDGAAGARGLGPVHRVFPLVAKIAFRQVNETA